MRAPGAEVAGEIIGPVSHFFRQVSDPLAGLFADHGIVFQSPAYGSDGNI
jgi:hypothetical protein